MFIVISGMIVLLFCLSFVVPSAMAQVETSPQTIKGDLLSIKGDVYVIKDISGRFMYSPRRHKYETWAHVGPG